MLETYVTPSLKKGQTFVSPLSVAIEHVYTEWLHSEKCVHFSPSVNCAICQKMYCNCFILVLVSDLSTETLSNSFTTNKRIMHHYLAGGCWICPRKLFSMVAPGLERNYSWNQWNLWLCYVLFNEKANFLILAEVHCTKSD